MLGEGALVHTPYGATEAVPAVTISSDEILSETRELSEKGFGMCVGRPLTGVEVRIIKISDDPIPEWSDDLLVGDKEIGELVACGEVVTRHYFERPEADAAHKIIDGDSFWHRMGDLVGGTKRTGSGFAAEKATGWKLRTDRFLPFVRIRLQQPPPGLSIRPGGCRRKGAQTPVICIELEKGDNGNNREGLLEELKKMAEDNDRTKQIDAFLIHKGFPVDIRHNAKIFREKLAVLGK